MIAMAMAIEIVITIQIMVTTVVVAIAGKWSVRESGSRPFDDIRPMLGRYCLFFIKMSAKHQSDRRCSKQCTQWVASSAVDDAVNK